MGAIRHINRKTGVTIEELRLLNKYKDFTNMELEEVLRTMNWFAEVTFKIYGELNQSGTKKLAA